MCRFFKVLVIDTMLIVAYNVAMIKLQTIQKRRFDDVPTR